MALVGLLFVANTINIGADLAAMGEAAKLVARRRQRTSIPIGFALVSLTLQLFIPYERYARYLKWLTLVLLAYVAVVFIGARSIGSGRRARGWSGRRSR